MNVRKKTDEKALDPFYHPKSIEELAEEQGVRPVEDFESLLGDFWPEDESVDDFLAERERWRQEEVAVLPETYEKCGLGYGCRVIPFQE